MAALEPANGCQNCVEAAYEEILDVRLLGALSNASKLGLVVLAFVALGVMGKIMTGGAGVQKAPSDPIAEKRFQAARVAHAAIIRALNDPDSARWDSLLTNEQGTVVCAEVRARNGFGGVVRGHFTVMSGLVSNHVGDWNKWCAKQKLYDYTDWVGYL